MSVLESFEIIRFAIWFCSDYHSETVFCLFYQSHQNRDDHSFVFLLRVSYVLLSSLLYSYCRGCNVAKVPQVYCFRSLNLIKEVIWNLVWMLLLLLFLLLILSFTAQVADNATLYGVCVFVPEMVQRAPAFFSMSTELSPHRTPRGRFLISAPRCYCFLTRLPYFQLHFEVLNRWVTFASGLLYTISTKVSGTNGLKYI